MFRHSPIIAVQQNIPSGLHQTPRMTSISCSRYIIEYLHLSVFLKKFPKYRRLFCISNSILPFPCMTVTIEQQALLLILFPSSFAIEHAVKVPP